MAASLRPVYCTSFALGERHPQTHHVVLSGANLAVIGDGSTGRWEVIQFRSAQLIAPDTYLIRHRLRGQAGTDGVMPAQWPAGSWFVLLDGAPEQIEMAANLRRISQTFRIGTARRPLDDTSYQQFEAAFDGIGLRSYSPCHLSLARRPDGSHMLGWIRRTRIDGDGWDAPEVPMGEESETYFVRVSAVGVPRREVMVHQPQWEYTLAERASDGVTGAYRVDVTQVSARFGEGPSRSIEVAA